MKNIGPFLLFLLLFVGYSSHSQQTVHFDYDLAGNRVLRYISSKELKAGDSLFLSPTMPDIPMDELVAEGEAAFIVYPNPTTDGITIENTGIAITGKLSYQLYDSQGKVHLQGDSPKAKTALDLQQLQAGTYLLRLGYDGKMQVFRVIKQ
ncbi:MAG: hypothetical protein CVT92_15565 [Bacteroidetes bacterium HGW-Bacteroidetes-1]|jgi:hypothetical protein|nr:MAG: hypothetical protein CVT92_15565 [Bacteroidetes bacterium HGW-Bacteroidetes-1]